MKYQAVLFDFDYTLGDATPSIYEGFCHAFDHMGLPRPQLDQVRRTVGHTLQDAYTMLTGDDSPQRREECRRWFHEKVKGRQAAMTLLLPGARELLQALHDNGVKVGIVTSKHSATLHEILDRYDLRGLLDFTIGGEGVAAPKPDPEGLNAGIGALGADRDKVLYCGDTTIDAATAQNAGVDFAAVLNGTTPAAEFAAYPSVHIAPDLIELKEWLGV